MLASSEHPSPTHGPTIRLLTEARDLHIEEALTNWSNDHIALVIVAVSELDEALGRTDQQGIHVTPGLSPRAPASGPTGQLERLNLLNQRIQTIARRVAGELGPLGRGAPGTGFSDFQMAYKTARALTFLATEAIASTRHADEALVRAEHVLASIESDADQSATLPPSVSPTHAVIPSISRPSSASREIRPIDGDYLASSIAVAAKHGAVSTARGLCALAVDEHPDDARFHGWRRALEPATVKPSAIVRTHAERASQQWVYDNAEKFRGEWVAAHDGALLDHDPSLAVLRERTPVPPGTFVTRIPE